MALQNLSQLSQIWWLTLTLLLSLCVLKDSVILFDLSSASDLVLHSLLLDKLSSYGFSTGYVNWFCSYLTNRQCYVRFSETFRRLSLHWLVFLRVLFWDLCCLFCTLMIYVVKLHIAVFFSSLMILKFFAALPQLMTVCFCKIGVMQITWKLMLLKRVISFSRKTNMLTFGTWCRFWLQTLLTTTDSNKLEHIQKKFATCVTIDF
jgi:hypothetical protein